LEKGWNKKGTIAIVNMLQVSSTECMQQLNIENKLKY